MNVLSLFDGMSCGQLVLDRAGIKYDKYFASEVDKWAIKITQKNYPDTIQLGDVISLYDWHLPEMDLLLGGSPCQGFSVAGKGLNWDDPRSQLFFWYVRALKRFQPKYFLFENVRMKREIQDAISHELGVEPIMIDSALVSAQSRKRLYWTNILNITQLENKGILLKDIVEDGSVSYGCALRGRYVSKGKTEQKLEFNKTQKSNALTTVQKDSLCFQPKDKNILLKDIIEDGWVDRDKSYCIDANYYKGVSFEYYLKKKRRQLVIYQLSRGNNKGGIKANDRKVPSMTSSGWQYNNLLVDIENGEIATRKLTPLECERLQTVPDGYTEGVSNTQRYKMLGNGWTIDVIVHILGLYKGELK